MLNNDNENVEAEDPQGRARSADRAIPANEPDPAALREAVINIRPDEVVSLLEAFPAQLTRQDFEFPTSEDFDSTNGWWENRSRLELVAGALSIGRSLMDRHYPLGEEDFMRIGEFLMSQGGFLRLGSSAVCRGLVALFNMGENANVRVNASVTLGELLRSDGPRETMRLASYMDLWEFSRTETYRGLNGELRRACEWVLCDAMRMVFFDVGPRWQYRPRPRRHWCL